MRKSREEQLDTPITSMIDVVFLLIIFFVVTSAIEKEAVDEQIQLAKSVHLDPVKSKVPGMLTINVRPGGDVTVGSALPRSMDQLRMILKNHKITFGNSAPIVIRADDGVQFAEVDKVMVEVGAAGLYKISLAAEHTGK
jgi:biopolymer transport protein ExbD